MIANKENHMCRSTTQVFTKEAGNRISIFTYFSPCGTLELSYGVCCKVFAASSQVFSPIFELKNIGAEIFAFIGPPHLKDKFLQASRTTLCKNNLISLKIYSCEPKTNEKITLRFNFLAALKHVQGGRTTLCTIRRLHSKLVSVF